MAKRDNRLTDFIRYQSLDNFLTSSPEPGVWGIDHNGLALNAFLDWRESETTLVTFTGAISPKVVQVPVWSAYGASSGLAVNRLFISDPTLALSDCLRLGWYAGNTMQPDLERDITELVVHATQGTRVVLFGPSGGGFTALVQAARLPGSTAIVSNPQTDISIRPTFTPYLQIAWDGIAPGEVPFTTEVVSRYQQPVDTKVIYLQNLGDLHHIEFHQTPFMSELHPNNKVITLSPNLGKGHIGPSAGSFNRLFDAVCRNSRWSSLKAAAQLVELTRNDSTRPSHFR